jgi:GNAT superfamily N-acetyltransferase
MITAITPDFLPHPIELGAGHRRDYTTLERFHYLAGAPATWAGVSVARYDGRLIAVAALSYPTASHRGRRRAFNLFGQTYGQRLHWANAHIRNISRVVVHPQFRALGLARLLIEDLCTRCTTPYIESSARMGRAHPMFERCGFTRIDPQTLAEPVYYFRILRPVSTFTGDIHASHSTTNTR